MFLNFFKNFPLKLDRSNTLSKNYKRGLLFNANALFYSRVQTITATNREINNPKTKDGLFNQFNQNCFELDADLETKEDYISKEKYNSLSDGDKSTLDRILFTYTGFYALKEKYISVDEFLLIPKEGREHMSCLFYNSEERYWQAQKSREKIDRMFKQYHFKLEDYIALPDNKRKTFIRFLDLPQESGMSAIEKGCFTVKDFVGLTLNQQESLLTLFNEHSRSGYRDYFKTQCFFKTVSQTVSAYKTATSNEESLIIDANNNPKW
ncbi:MAG: hypothetical protein WC785_08270 [Tatlockia sp.]|jgi:predicted NAD-dependent protein-ADP-ribosyltransferase YbiA (DUF1768 family)